MKAATWTKLWNEDGQREMVELPGRVCAWCGVVLQHGNPPVSHGICLTCYGNMEKKSRKKPRGCSGPSAHPQEERW